MKRKTKQNKKNNDKRTIIIIGLVLLLFLIGLIVCSILNNTKFSAKEHAKNYAEAVATGDKIKEYQYAGVIGENEFLSEKELKEKYKNQKIKELDSLEILEEKEGKEIKEIELPKKKENQQIFVAKYKLKNNKITRYLVITLEKAKNKCFVFSNWKVVNQDYFSNNVVVKIPKNTKAYINKKELTDDYKIETKEDNISYEIPTITKKDVTIELELKNGIKLEKTINPTSNKVIDLTEFSGYKLSKDSYETLEKVVKEFMDSYVSKALEKKKIKEVKENDLWTEELKKKEEFTTNYNTLVEKYKTKDVKNYKIKKIDVASSYIYSFDTVKVNANIEYEYEKNKTSKEKSTTVDLEMKNNDSLQIDNLSIYGLQYMF